MKLPSFIKYSLPLLLVWKIYAISELMVKNGLLGLIHQAVDNAALPETDEPLNQNVTGIGFLDKIFANLIPFFWPALDGSMPGLSLYASYFLGEIVAVWALVMLESIRDGNRWKLVMFTVPFGMMAQTITFGLTMPIYAIIYLATSPTARQPRLDNIISSPLEISVIPFSIFVGYILPSAITAFPETSTGPLQTIQERISFWQPWPIWISIVQIASSNVLSIFCSAANNTTGTTAIAQTKKARNALSGSRLVYAFAFGFAAILHIVTWSLSLTSVVYPSLFNPEVLHSLHPMNALVPTMPWSATKAHTLGQGAHDFLHYDHLVGVVAVLLWAIALHASAHSARNVKVGCVGFVVKIVVLCLVSGVSGAAVELMWERDELMLQGDEDKKKDV